MSDCDQCRKLLAEVRFASTRQVRANALLDSMQKSKSQADAETAVAKRLLNICTAEHDTAVQNYRSHVHTHEEPGAMTAV